MAPFWEGADRLTCRGDLVPRLPYWLPEEVTWPARSVPGRSAIGGGPWGLPGREPSERPLGASSWPPEKLGMMRRPEEPSGPVLSGFVGPFGGAGMMTNDDRLRGLCGGGPEGADPGEVAPFSGGPPVAGGAVLPADGHSGSRVGA